MCVPCTKGPSNRVNDLFTVTGLHTRNRRAGQTARGHIKLKPANSASQTERCMMLMIQGHARFTNFLVGNKQFDDGIILSGGDPKDELLISKALRPTK